MAELPFAPAIYEHKAKLIDVLPYPVSRSAELIAGAMKREMEVYAPAYLTVGLDIYNLEIEAMGGRVEDRGNACPELADLPPDFQVKLPDFQRDGRFELMLEAAEKVSKFCGGTPLRVAATGPVTLAAKITGAENLLIDLFTGEEKALELLDKCQAVSRGWLAGIREKGFDAIVFDSMASPPLFSPDLYAEHILPKHRELMDFLAASGQEERELVMGGDTAPIAGLLRESGANILLCDFAADAAAWKAAFGDDTDFRIRRNLGISLLDGTDYPAKAATFRKEAENFTNPIIGSGILPWDFEPEKLLGLVQEIRRG